MFDSQLIQVLMEQLRDPEPEERQYALDRLSDYSPDGAVNLIVPSLQDEDENVRIEAMACMRDIRDPSAIPHLIHAVDTASSNISLEYALAALSGFTGAEIRNCLIRTLSGQSISNIARMKIVMQMWRYVDDEVIEILKEVVLHDEDRNVRSHAADSLAFLFRVHRQPTDWGGFWEKVSKDSEIGVSRFAVDALRRLGRSP